MDIIISNSSDKPIYEQIKSQIKNLIIIESLKTGEILPSIRLLSKELRISVITVKRAYDELEKEGFIETVGGKGCFVSKKNKEIILEEQLHSIEENLEKAIDIAKINKISIDKIKEMLELLYKED